MNFDKHGEPLLNTHIRCVNDISSILDDLNDAIIELNKEKKKLQSALEILIELVEEDRPSLDLSKIKELI